MSRARENYVVTALFGVAALAAAGLVHFDPWSNDERTVAMVSTRSAARRVFPALGDRDVNRATIELQGPGGPLVRLVPGPGGQHHLLEGDELLGPADPEAVRGTWASLRMATTLRSVQTGSDLGSGQGGMIRVSFPDGSASLTLGREAPDGSGIYGLLGQEDDDPWVVEMEMKWLVEQPSRAWLARRVSPLDPEDISALAWGESLALGRGEDGIWRVQVGKKPAILSNGAVNQRLDRLLSARLDPLLARAKISPDSLRPWIVLTTHEGQSSTLVLGEDCPGHSDRRVVDRGPGLLGCVPKDLTTPWDVTHSTSALLESRLIPHGYGRVLVVDQRLPERRRLRRRTGGWLLEDGDRRDPADEAEVFRWFDAIARLEVEAIEDPSEERPEVEVEFEADCELLFEMDTTQVLMLRCDEREQELWCSRDDGPPLRVIGGRAAIASKILGFDRNTFVDRRLTAIASGDVRAIEILPGGATSGSVRQSVHRDLGTWKLDSPAHPDGDGALDEVRLEALVAVVGGLRADSWVADTQAFADESPLRILALDVAPRSGPSGRVEIALHRGCVVVVDDQQPAHLSTADCEGLGGDLFFDDPLRFWMDGARSIQLGEGRDSQLFRHEHERWTTDAGKTVDPAMIHQLEEWRSMRSVGLVRGEQPLGRSAVLTIRRDDGPTITLDVGPSWISLHDANWFYRTVRQVEASE